MGRTSPSRATSAPMNSCSSVGRGGRADDHGERRGARGDRRRGRRAGSNTATAPRRRSIGAMRAANGHPEPYGVKLLGDRQRDLGRLGPRPQRRGDVCAQLRPLRRGDARGRPVDPGHRRRRQQHGLEPHRAAGGRQAHRLPRRSTTTTAHGDGRGRHATCMARRCSTSGSTRRRPADPRGGTGPADHARDQRVGARASGRRRALLDASRRSTPRGS